MLNIRNFFRNFSIIKPSFHSQKSYTCEFRLVKQLALTGDEKTFVAWHPKPDFPYELSRPLPKPEDADNSSLIKETSLNTAMQAFKNKHPEVSRQELMNLTYTTKHRWFPRARDKKAKKTPMDRPYL